MWAEPSDLPKPFSRAFESNSPVASVPEIGLQIGEQNIKFMLICIRTHCKIIYINDRDVITNYYYIKGTVTPPALILLIKHHRHKAKGVHRLLSTVKGSCFISGRSLDVIIKTQVGPQCPDCVRAISCPLQFLSSVRLVFSCSCLSQTCSDIHSRSCWTLELSATHLLLLTWIGCAGQSWGRAAGREAISNPPATRTNPFNPQQLRGGSCKEWFLQWGSFSLLSFGGRTGWGGGGLNWDISGGFLLLFCLFSLSFHHWQNVWCTARAEMCEMISTGKETKPERSLEEMKCLWAVASFSQQLSLLKSLSQVSWHCFSFPTPGEGVFSSSGLFSGRCIGSVWCKTGVCLRGETAAWGEAEMQRNHRHMMSLSWCTQWIRKAGEMLMLWTPTCW